MAKRLSTIVREIRPLHEEILNPVCRSLRIELPPIQEEAFPEYMDSERLKNSRASRRRFLMGDFMRK
ncbi:MAG: hypothetical protein KJ879_00305 [Nanoarchaeota archaeon]|nr:hypothetical protein [Nanoarchaeota archaeon]